MAGRDEVRKGTWLGMSRSGRFAFLTNFREVWPPSYRPSSVSVTPSMESTVQYSRSLTDVREQVKHDSVTEGPSRGTLVVDYLKGGESPTDYLSSLDAKVTLQPMK